MAATFLNLKMLARHWSHYTGKNQIKSTVFPSKPVVPDDSTITHLF